MDLWDQGFVPVPTSGLHRLPSLQYLECGPNHIQKAEQADFPFPLPEIDCPISCLLPPNIEMLKVGPFAAAFPNLLNIIERKSELVPCLRKIILSVHYRDESLSARLKVVAKLETDLPAYSARTVRERGGARHRGMWKFPPSSEKPTFESFHSLCQQQGVELMIVYENTARREIFEEGAGPAVWEIADQIA